MIDNMKKTHCTGCNACYNICPTSCITMVTDIEGFCYPQVIQEECIKCNKCVKTCPSQNRPKATENSVSPKVYSAWSLNEQVRYTSTSGGVFSELAKNIIAKGGLVVGARYNDKHLVEHYIIDNCEEIKKIRQSKYIQSDIGLIYRDVKLRLEENRVVAFCGSPCQVAGLLNYLGKKYNNLVTLDFVCRGANSPKAYIKYLDMLENKYNSKVQRVWFKNKTYGWNRFSTKIEFENGQEYIQDRYSDLFMRGYIDFNLYMRPCCFSCQYKTFPRIADITLADFWGVAEYDKSLDDRNGISLIMINSIKGDALFNETKTAIFSKEQPLEIAIRGNACILKSAYKNPQRDKFLKNLDQLSFDDCINRFGNLPFYFKVQMAALQIGSRLTRLMR